MAPTLTGKIFQLFPKAPFWGEKNAGLVRYLFTDPHTSLATVIPKMSKRELDTCQPQKTQGNRQNTSKLRNTVCVILSFSMLRTLSHCRKEHARVAQTKQKLKVDLFFLCFISVMY